MGDRQPFFIIGTGRCGTAMLRNILNVWPTVKVLPETHFIIPLYNRFKERTFSPSQFLEVVDNIYDDVGNKLILRMLDNTGIPYKNYKVGFTDFVRKNSIGKNLQNYTIAFFKYLYGGHYIFGDKTPHYGLHLDVIKTLWPKSKIIHIYRDGVDTAVSMTEHVGFRKLISGGGAS